MAGAELSIVVTLSVPGFHQWPDAPKESLYLRALHRHQFKFVVEVAVIGSNREVEYHQVQNDVKQCLHWVYPQEILGYNFEARSCEHIAAEVAAWLQQNRTYRVASVEVWEDSENGSRLRFT